MTRIRPADFHDASAIWAILEPVIRGGETYTLARDLTRDETLAYWFSAGNTVFVAEQHGQILGTYFVRANQNGGGAHGCNCGYVTAAWASGRGVARAMCSHSLDYAGSHGFKAMQFNFVLSSTMAAVHLWQKLRFQIVARLPRAFLHPALGYIDALVMYREL